MPIRTKSPIQNVSEGLNIVANSLDWRGDNVIIVHSSAPDNIYLWLNLQRCGWKCA